MRPHRIGIAVLAVLLAAPFLVGGASAADVSKTLVASNFRWHDGSAAGADNPTYTINAGDTLRLTVIGDSTTHTFTVAHFVIDRSLAPGQTINVTITATTADVGTWQYICTIHGAGMAGSIVVLGTSPPPRTPGFEAATAIGALLAAFVVVFAARRLRR